MTLGTSVRCVPAARSLRAAGLVAPALGITRVTDITRLDDLGLCVYASVRPRGRTLRVHAGKGLTPNEARIGALMEAIEIAAAEHVSAGGAPTRRPVRDIVGQFGGAVQWQDFVPLLRAAVRADTLVPTVRCEWLGHRRRVWVPAELVLLPFVEPGVEPTFGWTTNGLASGNSLEEATLHAIFEVLERDAVAMNHARDASRWLPPDELPPPLAAHALAWRRRGVELIVRELPNDFGLPCFQACLHESTSTDVNLAGGSGLHASRQIALARAVCEAAQSRLSIIHGGRDDITGFYAKYVRVQDGDRARTESRLLEALRDPARRVALHEVAESVPPAAHPATLLRRLRRHLAERGFGSVLRLRIDTADGLLAAHGLFAVKVVVPRCETIEGLGPRVGPRLLARIVDRG